MSALARNHTLDEAQVQVARLLLLLLLQTERRRDKSEPNNSPRVPPRALCGVRASLASSASRSLCLCFFALGAASAAAPGAGVSAGAPTRYTCPRARECQCPSAVRRPLRARSGALAFGFSGAVFHCEGRDREAPTACQSARQAAPRTSLAGAPWQPPRSSPRSGSSPGAAEPRAGRG